MRFSVYIYYGAPYYFFISFLDHLCAASGIPSNTSQQSNHVLKVTYVCICSDDMELSAS